VASGHDLYRPAVSTTGARRDFDRCFRPTSSQVRSHWERLDLAQRRGVVLPPIAAFRQ
jgi:hypothetical protein